MNRLTKEQNDARAERYSELIARGCTQSQAAAHMGLTLNALSKWLERQHLEPLKTVRAQRVGALTRQGYSLNEIASFLGLSRRQVERLRHTPPPPPQPTVVPDLTHQSWAERAECAKHDPEWWFPAASGPTPNDSAARAICMECPVINQCRDYVMAMEGAQTSISRHGIWAGLDGRERYLLSRRQHRQAS